MKTTVHQNPQAMKKMFQGFLAMLLILSASSAFACGYGLRNVKPGKVTFQEVIKSNPYYNYSITEHTELRWTKNGQETVKYKSLKFADFGVTFLSSEVVSANGNAEVDTKVVAVQFEDLYEVRRHVRAKKLDLFKITQSDTEANDIVKELGEASSIETGNLVYDKLGLTFSFEHRASTGRQGKLKMVEWRPKKNA